MYYNFISLYKILKKVVYCFIFVFDFGLFIEKYLFIRSEEKSVK